ncbi:MAG: hypothetical protein JSV49_04745 [Thermoplasmata archaeon]|nr:MAG: hypothetical protein JSV49_04745 [Thermoplasmata archaeon]
MKLGNLFKRKSKKAQEEDEVPSAGGPDRDVLDVDSLTAMGDMAARKAAEAAAIKDALAHALPDGVEHKAKLKFEDGFLQYLVKITNNTDDIMGDVRVAITASESLVDIPDVRQSTKFIDPGKSNVFKFLMEPTMVCGKTEIQGLIRYFDFNEKIKQEYLLPEFDLNVSFPDISGQEVDEEDWRITMSRLKSYEIETEELNFEPHKVFGHFTMIVEKLGFYPLKPSIVPTLYRGMGKFFGLDPLKEPHCIEVQVIGSGKKARVLFRVWAPTTTRAMGVAFRVIGRIDKKLDIKNNLKKTS